VKARSMLHCSRNAAALLPSSLPRCSVTRRSVQLELEVAAAGDACKGALAAGSLQLVNPQRPCTPGSTSGRRRLRARSSARVQLGIREHGMVHAVGR